MTFLMIRENLIDTELDSSVAKNAKNLTILYYFVPKIKNIDRIAMVIWKYP